MADPQADGWRDFVAEVSQAVSGGKKIVLTVGLEVVDKSQEPETTDPEASAE